jgi:8-oxo-dGTP pyrophosphatase MutT (NUDIX family)
LDPWRRIGSTRLQRCGIFDLDRVRFEPPGGGDAHDFWVIDGPDWINVVPLTPEREVLLLRQFRFGVERFTLEIPGGMCDPGESPAAAARRELREETGFEARELVELGWVHPNPAVQTNRCHSFLARDVARVGPPEPDPVEQFELVRVPLAEIPQRIARREITHALVVAAFHLLGEV